MEMKVERNKDDYNLKAVFPSTDYGRTKTIGECGIFQIFRGVRDNKKYKM
jgi:hypothetical protein